jgi:hypothetical protein
MVRIREHGALTARPAQLVEANSLALHLVRKSFSLRALKDSMQRVRYTRLWMYANVGDSVS